MTEKVEIKISDLEKPMENVILIVKANVTRLLGSLSRGIQINPVIVADLDGKKYPIGNLEELEAYKESGSKKIQCIIIKAKNKMHVTEMHLTCNTAHTYNPILMMDVVTKFVESGGSPDVIPNEYKKTIGIKISKEAKNKIDKCVRDMAEKREEVPSMTHVLPHLSKVDEKKQSEAASKIVKYSNYTSNSAPPDKMTLIKLLGSFPGFYNDRMVTMPEIPKEEKPQDTPRTAKIEVESDGSRIKSHVAGIPDTILHKCGCGRQHTINMKTAVIREIKEDKSKIVVGDVVESKKPFMLRDEIVEMLGLELSPVIHAYPIGKKTIHAVILSKRRILKVRMPDIEKAINRRD